MDRSKTHRLWMVVLLTQAALACGLIAGDQTYVVQKNDTLSSIARQHHLSTKTLAHWNQLDDPDQLKTGTTLMIPEENTRLYKYIVHKGDSLANIAYDHGLSLARVARLNKLASPEQIFPGQTLLLPRDPGTSSLTRSLIKEIDAPTVKQGRWKNIVIHHSGSTLDSPKIMDNYHRHVRHMENGLAYHFVIGGSGPRMADGEIYIGERWKEQLQGGHVASEELNDESIGICLVGNFNEAPPTARQMEALSDLVEHLMDVCHLTPADVYTHGGINPKPTQCPGSKFSIKELKAQLDP